MKNIALLPLLAAATAFLSGQSSPSPSKSGAKIVPSSDVLASFAKGGTLAQGKTYRVMTAHRTSDGNVEVHKKWIDVFYVTKGECNIVLGGTVVDEKPGKDPDEPRGTSIDGGETHRLAEGDVIVIPAGLPHWMKDVKGTLEYFVVKVPAE
jgi:mannose-6-phosphate isomerase-like protein (cupin superfamily)